MIIHNDNPEIELTKEWLISNCELDKINYHNLTIVNESENVGMLFSRIKAFRSIENSEYTLFMDDDDYLYIKDLPEFGGYSWYRYNLIAYPSFEEVLQITENKKEVNTSKAYVNFNICAAFWKSDVLNKAFSYIENYKPT